MTDKQKAFVDEYLIDLNATRAYKAVYKAVKSDETAKAAASRLLTNVNVKDYLDRRMKDREKRTEITQDKVLAELAKIAFTNGSDFAKVVQKSFKRPKYDEETKEVIGEEDVYYKTVDVELTEEIPKEKLAAISGIKSTKEGIEVKLNDKVKALELIGRHLGMFKDKIELSGLTEEKNKLDHLISQMRGG